MSNQSGVYVKDKIYGWLPAQVSTRTETSATVVVSIPQHDYASSDEVDKEERVVKFSDYEEHNLPLQNVSGSGTLMVVADMCDLPSLHEAAILYNLKARHEAMEPYTRVGDIVIAMNPFQVSYYSDSISHCKMEISMRCSDSPKYFSSDFAFPFF